MRRVLQTTYGDGKNMWLGYLLKANQIKNGHVFVCPNNRFNHAIGKRFGNILGINNTSVTSRSLTNGETVFWVAKYELNRGPNDNVYLWVNPNLNNEPRKQNAISFIKNTNIGSIREIGVDYRSVGDFSIDRIKVADSYSKLVSNNSRRLNTFPSNQVEIKPYPNPVKNTLHFSNPESTPLEITIYSSLGKKLMYFSNFTQNIIDVNTLPSGLLFVEVKNSNKSTSKTYKIIKN